jgi:DnaJ-class molecular chaperone
MSTKDSTIVMAEQFVEQVEVGCYWCGGTGAVDFVMDDPEEEMPWHECEQCDGLGTVIVTLGDEE